MKRWEKISIVGGFVGAAICCGAFNLPSLSAALVFFAFFTSLVEVVED